MIPATIAKNKYNIVVLCALARFILTSSLSYILKGILTYITTLKDYFFVGELSNVREARRNPVNLSERIFLSVSSSEPLKFQYQHNAVEVSGLSPFVSFALRVTATDHITRKPYYMIQLLSLFKVASLRRNLRKNFQPVFMWVKNYKSLCTAFCSYFTFVYPRLTKKETRTPFASCTNLLLRANE